MLFHLEQAPSLAPTSAVNQKSKLPISNAILSFHCSTSELHVQVAPTMPSKYRRDKANVDASLWNLALGKLAKPLPLARNAKATSSKPAPSKKKTNENDTPRAFSRLFQPYRAPRSGQDDGVRPTKKRKTISSTTTSSQTDKPSQANAHAPIPPTPSSLPQSASTKLKIHPNEPLSHFSARVDAALPFSTIAKPAPQPSAQDPAVQAVNKPRQTKNEKKMQRMQRAWREEEARRKEKVEAENEEREGGVDEGDVVQKERRKGKRGRHGGKEEDPWRELEAKKREKMEEEGKRKAEEESGGGGLVGLHDVVKAPPKFKRVKMMGDDGMRVKQGGLKRQVEVSEARKKVVEGYRAMMRQKREGVGIR